MKPTQSLKILFACSEVFPLIKTGGLADVSFGLPNAIRQLGHNIKVVIPAYKQIIDAWEHEEITEFSFNDIQGHLLSVKIPNTKLDILLIDIPELYYRNGGPYSTNDGIDWPDNAERFSIFSKVVSQIALNRLDLSWQPDIVHCNDWQTGLVPAYLSLEKKRPSTLFTIHNLAYLGLFSYQKFTQLNLPNHWWAWNMLEFHNQFSLIKGGLIFADQINTVSPTYAEQIKTTEYGYGMEGLLNYRSHLLSGILNGVDYDQWNPETDPFIPQNYNFNSIDKKSKNKVALQKHFNLPATNNTLLIGIVGRMVEQKGYDLILQALTQIMQKPVQMVILGTGNRWIENTLSQNMANYPAQLSVEVGYSEETAHLIEAGADLFMMPSRFEPCGLNQFYSLKYGTIPFVSDTGGLSDSISEKTGFKFENGNINSLLHTFDLAFKTYQSPKKWLILIKNGMKQNYSWEKSAQKYVSLYQKSIKSQYHIPRNFSV